ncbi:hypothetical protein MBLNU230_g6364t1 [Neophaeotheca triangularis]
MIHISTLTLTFLSLSANLATLTQARNHKHNHRCSRHAIGKLAIPGAKVTHIQARRLTSYGTKTARELCSVNVTLTHPGTGDRVHNRILMPVEDDWNERYQGVGGGGYSAGSFGSLVPIAAEGYACSSTDAGHASAQRLADDAAYWALRSKGNVEQYRLLDFAYRSYHDMNVLSKQVMESFYGRKPKFSYWNGCSTGGRQGMVSAQRYPEDYDGILADAPAIQWNDFTPAQQWPFTVMNNEDYAPGACEFDRIRTAAIKACDPLDGLVDGLISAPGLCNFSAHSLVGEPYTCHPDGPTHTFNARTAEIIHKIWTGPRTTSGDFLWYGPTRGTNLTDLANTSVPRHHRTARPVPFPASDSWFRAFLAKNLDFNTSHLTYADYDTLFLQSHLEYDSTMGTASPDLAAFKHRGGKMLTWQGLADNLIMPQGTMLYYRKVRALDPNVADFYRQFYSPGVGHCGGGTGVLPVDGIGALRAWVEEGTAPEVLEAGSQYPLNASSDYPVDGENKRFQNLCPYPEVSMYDGRGDPELATSYHCQEDKHGWLDFRGPVVGNVSC